MSTAIGMGERADGACRQNGGSQQAIAAPRLARKAVVYNGSYVDWKDDVIAGV